jgi:hypothetical protein
VNNPLLDVVNITGKFTPESLIVSSNNSESSSQLTVSVRSGLSAGVYYLKLFATYENNGVLQPRQQIGLISVTVTNTPHPGVLKIFPLAKPHIFVGESATAMVSLENSSGITTPVRVAIISNDNNVVTLLPLHCEFTTVNNSCTVTIAGVSAGNTSFTAVASGYTNERSESVTVANMYAYITNNGSNNYTQCNVTRYGVIESASCRMVTPMGSGQLNIPSGIAFVGNYAYINNAGNNSYTQCRVGAFGIESSTCTTLTPTGSGALNTPGGIVFNGAYGYIANVNGNSYTQCRVDGIGILQTASCNTVTPSSGALNVPRSIGFSGTYAYIVNGGDDSYTQCNVTISGIDSASCTKVIPTGTGALAGPYEISFNGNYVYFTNGFSMLPENSYTQCRVNNGLIDSSSCNTITPVSPGALMIPVGIAFSGSYVYMVNHANDASYPPVGGNYTQCNLNNSGIDVTSCNTISLPEGGLNLPGGIAIH